jgi:HTH-type transcriptional regulator / antitoxin HipB
MIRTAEEFGRLIRKQRQAVGLTQDELAARCGVTRRTIIDLEGGKSGTHLGKALMAAWEVGLHLTPASPASLAPTHGTDNDDDPLATLPRF